MKVRRVFSLVFVFVFGIFVGYLLFNNAPKEPILETGQKVRIEKTVSEMEIGQSGYTVPWAVSYDGKSYKINPNYTIYPKVCGTVSMLVKRSRDGYHAYPQEKHDNDGYHWMNGIPIKVHY